MSIFKTTLSVIFAASLLQSCGGKDKKETLKKDTDSKTETPAVTDNGTPSKLEGNWEIKRAEGAMAETNVGTEYEFKGNKLSFGKGEYKNPGKTIVTDSTFSFQADGNDLVFMYNYKMNGDTLVVEMQKSGGQVFHMVKK